MAEVATKQTKIEGTYDEIPTEVQDAVDTYVERLRARMAAQKSEDTLRAEVIELMSKHKLERVPLGDDEEKFLELIHGKDKIKIKKRENAGDDE